MVTGSTHQRCEDTATGYPIESPSGNVAQEHSTHTHPPQRTRPSLVNAHILRCGGPLAARDFAVGATLR